jgi:hypothetical protein
MACLPVIIGATVVIAAVGSQKRNERLGAREGDGPRAEQDSALTGQASGGGCRLGFDAQVEPFVPAAPDKEGFVDVAAVARINKPCQGVVVGQFVTETALVEAPTGTGFLHADMVAVCVSKGGYTNPCTPGSEVYPSPGEIWLDDNVQPETETRSMNEVWRSLKRGVWDFYVLVWGDGENAAIGYRTFHVEAFSGGPSA